MHEQVAAFRPAPDATWSPWLGRDLGGPKRIISHCDVAPWNIVAQNGLPIALIDWELSGPVDPIIELAQACWLNAKLHSDDVAELFGLPPLAERARQLRAIVDAYGLSKKQRQGFIDRIIEFTVHDIAFQADEASVTRETVTTDSKVLWGMAWRARAAAWQLRHRRALQNAIT